MPGLMGEHVYVGIRGVEVGEYERRLVVWDVGAVSSGPLSLPGLKVHELVLHHELKKLLCLRRELTVHPYTAIYYELGITLGLSVSCLEFEIFIKISERVKAQPSSLPFKKLRRAGHDMLAYLASEYRNHLGVVVSTHHPYISKLGKALKSKLERHGVANAH